MIKCAADIAKAYDEGGYHLQPFVKVWASTFNTANAWFDGTLSGIKQVIIYHIFMELT